MDPRDGRGNGAEHRLDSVFGHFLRRGWWCIQACRVSVNSGLIDCRSVKACRQQRAQRSAGLTGECIAGTALGSMPLHAYQCAHTRQAHVGLEQDALQHHVVLVEQAEDVGVDALRPEGRLLDAVVPGTQCYLGFHNGDQAVLLWMREEGNSLDRQQLACCEVCSGFACARLWSRVIHMQMVTKSHLQSKPSEQMSQTQGEHPWASKSDQLVCISAAATSQVPQQPIAAAYGTSHQLAQCTLGSPAGQHLPHCMANLHGGRTIGKQCMTVVLCDGSLPGTTYLTPLCISRERGNIMDWKRLSEARHALQVRLFIAYLSNLCISGQAVDVLVDGQGGGAAFRADLDDSAPLGKARALLVVLSAARSQVVQALRCCLAIRPGDDL